MFINKIVDINSMRMKYFALGIIFVLILSFGAAEKTWTFSNYTVNISDKLYLGDSAYLPDGSSVWIGGSSDSGGPRLRMYHSSATNNGYIDYEDLLYLRPNASGSQAVIFDASGNINISSGRDVCIVGGNCLSSAGSGGGYWNLSGGNLYPENLSYKVGIGTSSPTATLDVNGSILINTNDLYNSPLRIVSSESGVSSDSWLTFETDGGLTVVGKIGDGSSADSNFSVVAAIGDLVLSDSSGETMRLKNGNVGIGTSSPTAKLHVVGSTGTDLFAWTGGGVRRLTDQGGLSFGSDSSVLLHAGDNRVTLPSELGITSTTTTETLYLTADGQVRVITNDQSGYASAKTYVFETDGDLNIPKDLIVREGGYLDDDSTLGGNGDDWIGFKGYVELHSNTDSYGVVVRDKDTSSYLGLTQIGGVSYLADSAGATSYFLKGDGLNAEVGNDLTVDTLRFKEGSNFRIDASTAGLLFDGGDGAWDFLIYDNLIYSDILRLGYSGAAEIRTYDSGEDLKINPNGAGDINMYGGNVVITIGDSTS